MTLLQALGLEKTAAEQYIDERRPDFTFDIEVSPEDYNQGEADDPENSPLAIAVKRAIQDSGFKLDRAGFKVIILSRGIYEYGYFLPRRVWRQVNSKLFFSDTTPSKPIKFTATFSILF